MNATRVDLRVPGPVKDRLRRVAALSGRSMSDFIISAALEKADEVNASIERWEMDAADSRVVMEQLLDPQDHPGLRRLFATNPAAKREDVVKA